MAITVGTTVSIGPTGANPATFNLTVDCGAGSDRFLVVGIEMQDSGSVDSITYNTVAMTLVDSKNDGSAARKVIMYGLVAPATGSNTLTVNLNDTWSRTCIAAVPFSGVHQTTPLGTAVLKNNADSGEPSVTVSSAVGELVIDAVMAKNDFASVTLTVDASQTQQVLEGGDTFNVVLGMSTEVGATSVSMDWIVSNEETWAGIAVPIKPIAAAGGRTTKNTRGWGLGTELGMGIWMPNEL